MAWKNLREELLEEFAELTPDMEEALYQGYVYHKHYQQQWYAALPPSEKRRIKARVQEWKDHNREKYLAYFRERYARKKGGPVRAKAKNFEHVACTYEDASGSCSLPHFGKGLCAKHYQRWWKANHTPKPKAGPCCTSPGCTKHGEVKGMCRNHYQQARKAAKYAQENQHEREERLKRERSYRKKAS